MSDRRKIQANIVWLVGERVVRLTTGFVIFGLLARHFGPESFGLLNYATGMVALFLPLASLGLETVVVREVVRAPAEAGTILGTALALRLAGAILGMVIMVAASPWLAAGVPQLPFLLAVGATALAWQAFDVIDSWFQSRLESRNTVMAKFAALLVGTALKLWLLRQDAGLVWFVAAFSLDGICYAVALAVIYRRRGERFAAWRFHLDTARRLLRVSWPLVTSGFLVACYFRLDQVLILRGLGERDLGLYSAAGKVADVWAVLSSFALTSIFPLLVARHRDDPAQFGRDLQFAFDAMTASGYFVAVSVSITAPFLMPVVFGDSYRASGYILAILAWSAPFVFSGGVRAHYFLLEGNTSYHNWTALLGIGTNLALALVLMPRFGAMGVAIAVVVSSALSAIASSFLFSPLRTCGRQQLRALAIPFRPAALGAVLRRTT